MLGASPIGPSWPGLRAIPCRLQRFDTVHLVGNMRGLNGSLKFIQPH